MSIYIYIFSAHVQKPSNAMYAIVLFNFKKRQKVKTKYLVPMGGAVPRPELAVSIYAELHIAIYSAIRQVVFPFNPISLRTAKTLAILSFIGLK